ncbi:MAG: UDP-N-acetylmuramate dehydrogenase [Patescibacteria group bacterium]|jgi:UDP-N-acetylmuramate dehydrogenase|nr:UDP-N-acetylmuramate dehydrogenase [Patescibacteria group bacterium]
MERKQIKMELQKNILLKQFTTFQIGGPAEYFVEISDLEGLKNSIQKAYQQDKPFFVLGGGSNLLVSDSGFKGLVIKIKNVGMEFLENNNQIKIIVLAGTPLALLLQKTLEMGLTGLEWAAGIPGTVGGAIFGNSGAYGQSMGECINKVLALNPQTFEIYEFSQKECEFSYRDSIFKRNNFIILSAEIILLRGDKDLIKKKVVEYIKERRMKTPPYPSAGCIFKNISIDKLTQEQLRQIPPEKIKGGKVPVGYLIDQCGLRGKRIGDAQISEMHANFIINLENAKAAEVYQLINLCKEAVLNKFGINLEEEIRYLGNF